MALAGRAGGRAVVIANALDDAPDAGGGRVMVGTRSVRVLRGLRRG